ncbi:MAG: hypothetical protein ACK5MV_06385 [Aminipila sp.]
MMRKVSGASEFFILGLYSFAGFGLEILLLITEQYLFGVQFPDSLHWILTSILWGGSCIVLIGLSKSKHGFDIMKEKQNPNLMQWGVAALICVICITITTIVAGGFKLMQESLNKTLLDLIFQNIYYVFESGLMLLTIIFGQQFGELLLKDNSIPYGGIFLASTWGAIHFLTQDVLTGIYVIVISILYGIIYLVLKKNTYYSDTIPLK